MSESSTAHKLIANNSSSSVNATNTIDSRRSQELIIGLCGAIGSGVKALKSTLCVSLERSGYDLIHVRISDIIIEKTDSNYQSLIGYNRYKTLQDAGDSLRKEHDPDILAACAISKISIERDKFFGDGSCSGELTKTDKKVAYIIDQIKHPAEVKLLRKVYPKNFYLIGLIRTEKERINNLEEEQISPSNVDELIRRDRKDDNSYGQQVEKSLYNADFFIRNTHNQSQFLENAVDRFIKLIHGVNGITPTNEEIGMHAAYSASLKSACLSRQVGAAIMGPNGRVISTGCNDVPEFGGGLYSADSIVDFRCVHSGHCSNDKHKSILKQEIVDLIDKEIHDHELSIKLADIISSKTKIKSLIEYSRAIHAEMDAIVALSRLTSESTVGTTLYATTYPCHNCARHIVAAGIVKVVYIEPYEKSLALKLHSDAISDSYESDKVKFMPFEGVSPTMFERFFKSNGNRKDSNGRTIQTRVNDLHHIDSQFLDSYHEYEAKITQIVENKFQS